MQNNTHTNSRVVFNLDDEEPKTNNQQRRTERDTPPPKNNPRFNVELEDDEMQALMEERRKRLRSLNMLINSPADINELEREPAYKRRNVSLEDVPHSSESNVSKYSLFEEEKNKTEIKQKPNPYLHDNLD